jgi:APA family basic amino acid/polyamine antiporter
MLSFVLSGMGCAFAGLCYAEFAAMIPLAGSAYTYAYATLGELMAWIIGWDLTLEYAMGASTVSSGWSNHFIELLNMFHIKMPLWLAYDHWTALSTAEKIVARQTALSSDPTLVPGTQAFLDKVASIMCAANFWGGDWIQFASVHYCAGDYGDSGGGDQGERAV